MHHPFSAGNAQATYGDDCLRPLAYARNRSDRIEEPELCAELAELPLLAKHFTATARIASKWIAV